jgi:hypothetical protein
MRNYRTALLDSLDPEGQQRRAATDSDTFDASQRSANTGYGGTAGNAGGGEVRSGTDSLPVTDTNPIATASQPAAGDGGIPAWATSASAHLNSPVAGGQNVLLGFDTGKLNDPNYHSNKYSNAAKTYFQGLENNVGISRGGLGNMVTFAQQNGFKNAKAVGDDKIDFGDGQGPVDVIGSNGEVHFENQPETGGGGGASSGGGGLSGLLSGDDPTGGIDAAIGKYGGQSNFLQSLLAALGGGQ